LIYGSCFLRNQKRWCWKHEIYNPWFTDSSKLQTQ
jgi:hypothetical protein